MVKWLKIDEKLQRVRVEEVPLDKIFDSEWNQQSMTVTVPLEDVEFDFDLRNLARPLGQYFKTLYVEKDYSGIKDALSKYWLYRGKPKIFTEIVDTGTQSMHLRSKITAGNLETSDLVDLNKLITDINSSFQYTRSVIGTDGANLEIQFLDSGERKEVRKGDFVDCGLFVHVNGQVKVAPGINRLVCTNGLTERMFLWEKKEYKIDNEFVLRAGRLATWLMERATHKVTVAREISIALNDYPKSYMNRFWKSWSERIDLGELTWFDVISDVTSEVNRTLSPIRYKALAMPQDIVAYEENICRCPTCSAQVSV